MKDPTDGIISKLNTFPKTLSPSELWSRVSKELLTPNHPFSVHQQVFEKIYENWDSNKNGPPPAWIPSTSDIQNSNISAFMRELEINNYQEFQKWSVANREEFWERIVTKLNIRFERPYKKLVDFSKGLENPNWFPGAKLNIAESCFSHQASSNIAVISKSENRPLERITLGELDRLSNLVANGVHALGIKKGEAIAIDMAMSKEAVAIYLGVVKAGCVVIGIADSFAPKEIATRLRIGKAKAVFTQDGILRAGKILPMYEKVMKANAPQAIVLSAMGQGNVKLRSKDLYWNDFLSSNDQFQALPCNPHDPSNILFSSGTTGEPKAIPWTHTTPIKCAADAYLHHNIQPGDVLAWPTSLGWMMGPWLIYAALINRGTLALFDGIPSGKEFAEFVQEAEVTMLGVVPSLVKAWKNTNVLDRVDWSKIKIFSSTGECSNANDMLYLMSKAGYKPVIEYCGGTEIGGGYISGTVVQPSSPATFSTPALGLDIKILNDKGQPAQSGELYILPPSLGLSTELLNQDHHEVYYKDTLKGPKGELLRRHGDQMERLSQGYFCAHGRADDTMNLGGIKTSSAEMERILNQIPKIHETAVIAVEPKDGGPSQLVIYVVANAQEKVTSEELWLEIQKRIKTQLNPLFKISDVVLVPNLPRTASNKVMRRVLRAQYQKK